MADVGDIWRWASQVDGFGILVAKFGGFRCDMLVANYRRKPHQHLTVLKMSVVLAAMLTRLNLETLF